MSKRYPRLAICGQLRAGKDEVANYLEDQYGFYRVAFGDKLKEAFHAIYTDVPKEPKPRRGYQVFGQACREFDPYVWIKHALNRALEINEAYPVVITDLRQPNEYIALMAAGFRFIKVVASESVRLERCQAAGDVMTLADLQHDTEQHVERMKEDYLIINEYSLDKLHEEIDAIIRQELRQVNNA